LSLQVPVDNVDDDAKLVFNPPREFFAILRFSHSRRSAEHVVVNLVQFDEQLVGAHQLDKAGHTLLADASCGKDVVTEAQWESDVFKFLKQHPVVPLRTPGSGWRWNRYRLQRASNESELTGQT
jgi:hypothetical protein